MQLTEMAAALGIARATANKYWALAKAKQSRQLALEQRDRESGTGA
ncbi:MAG: hypothetical protein H6837_07365 [Planctomycetes bacterium]|nr:hypothetical protein [Planctomycetota bacterium]